VPWPDHEVERWITEHRTETLVDLARAVTRLGDSVVVGIGVIAAGALLARRARRWTPLGLAAAGWLAVEAAARAIKAVTDRPRPPFDDAVVLLANGAFPSAHVARAAFLAAVVALTVGPRWRPAVVALAIVAVAGVAWSRIELGTHWLSDTVAAWPLGLLAAWPLGRSVRGHGERRLPSPPCTSPSGPATNAPGTSSSSSPPPQRSRGGTGSGTPTTT
jgi:undecaprenyl-diphosphatase